MKYLMAFKAKAAVSVVSVGTYAPIHTENHDEENAPKILNLPTLPYLSKIRSSWKNNTYTYGEVPTETTKSDSVVFVGSKWSRPDELAKWPIERRQRWGELANQLEAAGLTWDLAEQRAFEETSREMEAS